jgi:hypothetical protein
MQPLNIIGIHQRGLVVSVYTCPESCNLFRIGSSAKDLFEYEMGTYGKYFD